MMINDPLPTAVSGIRDVISARLQEEIGFGKYSQWSLNLPISTLVELLKAIDALGREYNRHKTMEGCYPEPHFAPGTMPIARMTLALEQLAVIRSGIGKVAYHENYPELSTRRGSAFRKHFRDYLEARGVSVGWAAELSQRKMLLLLWQVGEYGIRVRRGRNGDEDFPAAVFDVSPESAGRIRKALKDIASIFRAADSIGDISDP